ncbi:MAG: hypothetical protein ABIH00_06745, partial [Armatimonadota bacterium]
MEKKKHSKGFIATIMFYLVLSIILAFTVQMFVPRHMQLMRVKEDRIDAYSAAMMGIEYIKNEIEKNYKWEGG